MRPRLLLSLLTLLCLPAQTARASCFSIFENGVRAAGMGGAFAAIANDGSALFYNPAGIAFQQGMRMQMDGLVVVGLFRFDPSSTPPGTEVPAKGYNLNVSPHFIPVASMYMTKDLSPKLTFGFGMYAPFGLAANATNFDDSDPKETKFVGRYAGTRGKLESFWFQPTVAYRLAENTSIGLGIAWVHTHLLIEQSILNPLDDGRVFGEELAPKIFPGEDKVLSGKVIARLLPEGRSRLAGTSDRPGYTFGLLQRMPKFKTNVGLMWRSAVTHKLDGQASFAFTTGYPLEDFVGKETIPDLFPTQPVKASFTTPATYSIGVANSSFWGSTISAQFDFQDYSRFQSVPVNFSKTEGTATPPELRLNFDFEDSYILRFGMEKRFGERTAVRAGYIFDHSPVKDPSVNALFPDSSRNSLTVGISRLRNNMELSMFYQAMWFMERTTNVPENNKVFTNGSYQCFAHLFGFGLRMHLGAPARAFD